MATLDFILQPHCCSRIIFPFSTSLRACRDALGAAGSKPSSLQTGCSEGWGDSRATGTLRISQQVSPSRSQTPFGTPPLPKELQRVFLTPFKQDTDIHSPRPSHKHSARVGGRCEARTRLHQRDALHPGTAAPPAVGTANHHVLVKRESAVLSRQRKPQISRQRPQAIALFSFSERHFGVSKPPSLVRSGRG